MSATEQKLISFTYEPQELEKINKEIEAGWSIVSLARNNNYFVGIMEKHSSFHKAMQEKGSIYIPPRKKIRIISKK